LSRYTELQTERQRIWEQAKAIADRATKRGTDLTPIEERRFDSLVAQLDRLTDEQRVLGLGARIAAKAEARGQDPRLGLVELMGKRYPPEPQTPLQQIVELQRRRGRWIDEGEQSH
jgi:hypothetical protein